MPQALLGRVVVIAGDDPVLASAGAAVVAAGAVVAVVSTSVELVGARVRFGADAADDDVWERIAMHVEQHLGPVDGVVTDRSAAGVVTTVFGPDLARRGHGTVVVAYDGLAAEEVVSRLVHRR
jgi:hypothetical protein